MSFQSKNANFMSYTMTEGITICSLSLAIKKMDLLVRKGKVKIDQLYVFLII